MGFPVAFTHPCGLCALVFFPDLRLTALASRSSPLGTNRPSSLGFKDARAHSSGQADPQTESARRLARTQGLPFFDLRFDPLLCPKCGDRIEVDRTIEVLLTRGR